MHYIRYLKPPRVDIKRSGASVKALVTITTDLGDDFLQAELQLHSILLGASGRISEWRTINWKPGMRVIWIEVDFVLSTLRTEAFTLLVSCRRNTDADEIAMESFPDIMSARSRVSISGVPPVDKIERRLRTMREEIHIFEEMGESIARHLW